MIVDYESDVTTCLDIIAENKTLLVPIYANPTTHESLQDVYSVYVYCEGGSEWLIPMHHTEQIRGFNEYLTRFLELDNIFIHERSGGFKLVETMPYGM